MSMKKAKIKAKPSSKKKMVPPSPVKRTIVEYFIDEMPNTFSTDEMENRCDTYGKEGWRLIGVGPYGAPNTVRLWFMREL